MMFKKCKLAGAAFLIAAFLGGSISPVQAAVPKLLAYDGVLKDTTGNFLTGSYALTFRIYAAATGGSALWTEAQPGVSASSGKFSVILGSVNSLNTLDFNTDYWLSVQVGADAEMSPRIRLTSMGYGIRSDYENNGFTQAQHDALSHKNIEGIKDNQIQIAKTNFKLDSYSMASANSMGDLVIDSLNDANGIDTVNSAGYGLRTKPYSDLIVTPGGIDGNTKLILHANGADGSSAFTDSSNVQKTTTVGGVAQIDTAQQKFGTASGLFNVSDYVKATSHADFAVGTGNFTADFWVMMSSINTDNIFTLMGTGTNFSINYCPSISGGFRVWIGGSWVDFSGSALSVNTWYHLALTRSSGTLRLFINGVQYGANQTTAGNIVQGDIAVGGQFTQIAGLQGWLDEYRFSNAAIWTSNFSTPACEYTVAATTATVYSTAYAEPVAPTQALVIADETLNTGTITYYVSRNDGGAWTLCPKETVTSLSGQPSGTQLKWKAVITGNAELNAISVAV